MNYAVCCVPVAPLRTAPDHRTEMISQLLFGERCIIKESDKKGWVKIICKADGYEGWCQLPHVTEINEGAYNVGAVTLAADWINEIEYHKQAMYIPLGSLLWTEKSTVEIAGEIWHPVKHKRDAETIKEIAFKFLNTAYLWGGI
jgi:gamma-D-glutamyl-L-lysine dipeptidyl-peptidase